VTTEPLAEPEGTVIMLVVRVAAVCAAGALALSACSENEPPPQETVTQTVTASPIPQLRESFGDGTWKVGVDIVPGSYFTEYSDQCRWTRQRGSEVVATGPPAAQAILTQVTVDDGEVFRAENCGRWTKTS
jgi:hypothetical protein